MLWTNVPMNAGIPNTLAINPFAVKAIIIPLYLLTLGTAVDAEIPAGAEHGNPMKNTQNNLRSGFNRLNKPAQWGVLPSHLRLFEGPNLLYFVRNHPSLGEPDCLLVGVPNLIGNSILLRTPPFDSRDKISK
jgi:hypothetical protein